MNDTAFLQQKNLEALDRRYYADTEAEAGLEYLLSTSEPKLERLLRSHLIESVGTRATVVRDAVDDFLTYVGVLELGSLTGAIPWPLKAARARNFRRALDRPAARRYYEFFYPLLLPTLFRWRLEDGPLFEYGEFRTDGPDHLQEFVALSDMTAQPDVEAFLWFLDDGESWDKQEKVWVDLNDFFQVLGSPKELIRRLGRVHDNSPLTRSVRGFGKFLAFAEAFDLALCRMQAQPLLQSALWQHHAYWFYQLSGQVGGVIAASIEEFREYASDSGEKRSSKESLRLIEETQGMMDRAQLALRRLTSAVYRGPLEAKYFERVLEE